VGGPPPRSDGRVAECGPDEARGARRGGRGRCGQVADEPVCRVGGGDVLVLAGGVVKGLRGLCRAEPGAETASQCEACLAGERFGTAPEFFQGDAQRVNVPSGGFFQGIGFDGVL
jgi:hypothetical protein